MAAAGIVVVNELPSLAWSELATKTDLAHLGTTLGSDLNARIAKVDVKITDRMDKHLRTMVFTILAAVFTTVGGTVAGIAALGR